jgi:hypothetical protein
MMCQFAAAANASQQAATSVIRHGVVTQLKVEELHMQ